MVIALIPSPLLLAFQVGTFCMNVFITFNTILLLAIKKMYLNSAVYSFERFYVVSFLLNILFYLFMESISHFLSS